MKCGTKCGIQRWLNWIANQIITFVQLLMIDRSIVLPFDNLCIKRKKHNFLLQSNEFLLNYVWFGMVSAILPGLRFLNFSRASSLQSLQCVGP